MKIARHAAVGQSAGDLSCCGRPMQHVDNGIYECRGCGCHVFVVKFKIDEVSLCSKHS